MARILFFSDLNQHTDLLAVEQIKELARQLVHTGHSVTLVSSSEQAELNRHWQELSQSGCMWIQPSKRWGLMDTVFKTPSFLNSPADLLHFFVDPNQSQFLSSFLWIAQILGQWRNSLTVISLTAPLKPQPSPLVKNFLAQAHVIFSWDQESLRLASALKESSQGQLLFESPLFCKTFNQQKKLDESEEIWSFLPRPFLYAPGIWQDRGNLVKLAAFLKKLAENSEELIVAGWNWREQKEGALKEFFTSPLHQRFFFPAQVHLESHIQLSHLCSGFILRQLSQHSLIYKESSVIASANRKSIVESIEDLNESKNINQSSSQERFLSENPIHFFNRAYEQALTQL